MTKVAIWCRHEGDNIIGIGDNIPWRVPSDFARFGRIVAGRNIVVGRRTYETLPPKFDKEKIFVLTGREGFILRNEEKHLTVNEIKFFKNFEEDIYISGGAGVYGQFLAGGSKLMPDIIVDCIYHGALSALSGKKADITDAVEIMRKKYRQVGSSYEKDNVSVVIYVKSGDFVEQSVLKHIIESV